jgi:oligopeptide/dipeptide ABC transporter ATP-binding protein
MSNANILEVENLDKRFRVAGGLFSSDATVHAVVDAGLTVPHRGSLGLVGESGCGKSTLARCLLRLVEPDDGRIVFEGKEVRSLGGAELRLVRRRMQMIFQDPYGSLNPRRTVAQTLTEPLHVHRLARGKEAEEKVAAALAEVGLPLDSRSRFPHEFSGGQRQRIGIARALILEPTFIVADEPVSALDVSVQAQVLKLLESLREKRALSMLFVSHDLGVVRHVCDRVAVMYLGRVVEEGPVPQIFDRPLHPYTQMLRAASPVPDPKARFALQRVTGEIPSAMNPPPGCAFSSRCPHVMPRCREEVPALREVEAGRQAACHLLDSSK